MNLLQKINEKAGNEEDNVESSDVVRAVFLNCTLKPSNIESNTRVLIDKVVKLMDQYDVISEVITVADYNVSPGLSVDRVDDNDEFPEIYKKLEQADIVVMAGPIWFGVRSSIAQLVMERMIGSFEAGNGINSQYAMYGKIAGVIITGNEDGAHDVLANSLSNMSHMGFICPPNCDTYWVGDAGAGPSYKEAGQRHLYTNKNAAFMAHNLPFYARLSKANPNPINMTKLIKEAEKVSDTPIGYKTHDDEKAEIEKSKAFPTDRERAKTDNS